MARLVFLGRLEDCAGTAEMAVPVTGKRPLAEVIAVLPEAAVHAVSDPRIRIAINGELVGPEWACENLTVSDGDEIAFLPPVSGG